jgi:chaperonin GroES
VALKVLGDRVLIKVDEPETTEGGIHLPESAQEKPQRGTVVAVGEGQRLEDGTMAPPDVAEGDRVVFAKYGGTEITEEGEEYILMDSDQIYAKL